MSLDFLIGAQQSIRLPDSILIRPAQGSSLEIAAEKAKNQLGNKLSS